MNIQKDVVETSVERRLKKYGLWNVYSFLKLVGIKIRQVGTR